MQLRKPRSAWKTLLPILESVQVRRNKALAHLDPQTVTDPSALDNNAKLTLQDLENVFTETEATLNDFARLSKDVYSHMRSIGEDDLEAALQLIADAKHAQVDRWEKDFPTTPCDFPRPQMPRSKSY